MFGAFSSGYSDDALKKPNKLGLWTDNPEASKSIPSPQQKKKGFKPREGKIIMPPNNVALLMQCKENDIRFY